MKTIRVSEDIVLRPLEEADALSIFNTIDSEREYLGRWLYFVPFTKSVDDSLAYIHSVFSTPDEYREKVFVIIYKEQFAGLIGLKFNQTDKANYRTEIGYWLSEKYQRKGIVTLSADALIHYAFEELDMNRIQIRCAVENIRSSNIPKRLGFVFEGVERDGEYLPCHRFTDVEVYSLLKRERQTLLSR